MLLASVILYLITSIVLCRAFFQKLSFANYLLTFFLTAFTLNVAISEILSLFGILNSVIFYFALQTLFSALLCTLVMKHWHLGWHDLLPKKPASTEKADAVSVVLTILACLPLLVLLIVGLQTPPNNLDTLHTHLPRIYYWLQHGSLDYWPASNMAQLNYPLNANLQGLWLFLLGHNERLFFLVSWFAILITCVSVYQIARTLQFTRRQALLSILVALSIPTVLLQSYSFQNDLAVTAMISVTIFLLLSYFKTKRQPELILALLALSLALGIKQTAFMALPAILLWVLYEIIRHRFERKHIVYLALLPVFFLVFSSYVYVQNEIDFNSFFGTSDVLGSQNAGAAGMLSKLEYNIPRFVYNSLSVDGLNSKMSTSLTKIKAAAFKALTSLFHIDLEKEVFLQPGYSPSERFGYLTIPALTEDTAWFGPLSVLLAFIAFFLVLIQKNKERKEYLLVMLALNFSYSLAILIQRPGWDPYQSRYFLAIFLPVMPLIGVCTPEKKILKEITTLAISICFICLTFNIVFFNESKPLITASTIVTWQNQVIQKMPQNNEVEKKILMKAINYTGKLSTGMLQRQSILSLPYYEQMFYSNQGDLENLELVNSVLPADQPLYLLISSSIIEYPLFGVERTRDLFPITDPAQTPLAGYLLILNSRQDNLLGLTLIKSNSTYSIYQRVQ